MDDENDGTGGGFAAIDAPLTWDVSETPAFNGFVECLVPDLAGLFHPIETFHEFHNPVFFTG